MKQNELWTKIQLIGKTGKYSALSENFTYEDDKIWVRLNQEIASVYIIPLKVTVYKAWKMMDFGVDINWAPIYIEILRPGKWMEYIDKLAEKINIEKEKIVELQRSPIDDSDIFG